MQIKLFTVPITAVADYNEEINAFLRGNKIIDMEKQLIQTPAGVYWCLFISYVELSVADKSGKEKIDYMHELPPDEFARFSVLRKIRTEMAKKEGVSAFVIFTNGELAEMAKMPELTAEKLKTIKGIGKSKIEKYAAPLLEAYQKHLIEHEKSGQPDTPDSHL